MEGSRRGESEVGEMKGEGRGEEREEDKREGEGEGVEIEIVMESGVLGRLSGDV